MNRDTHRNNRSTQRPFQIINDKAQFTDGLESFLKSNQDIQQWGSDYTIISVIGGQSSGKSTLLNGLFGTQFDVLDSSQRRTQTTQGVWIQRDIQDRILILDMEGSDSTSRWDSSNFEKYVSLFALTLSDHLLVNIWTTVYNKRKNKEVGRFQASQYSALRVALELNIRLWNVEQTKSIFFVLRDFQETENLSYIKEQIYQDLQKIWNEIKKPPKLLKVSLDEVFRVQITTLSNKIYEPQRFDNQIQQLRGQLINHNPILKQNVKKTPLDGLPLLAVAIWNTITSQQDLNLPDTRKIVSQIRIDQILQGIFQIVNQQVNQLSVQDPQQVFISIQIKLKEQLVSLLDQQTKIFCLATENYEQDVIATKKQDLIQRIIEISQPQISILILNYMNQLQQILQTNLLQLARSKGNSIIPLYQVDYNTNIISLKQQVLLKFKSQISELRQFITDQGIQNTLSAYENNITIYVNSFKEQLYDHFVKDQFQNFKTKIDKLLEVQFLFYSKEEFKRFEQDTIKQIMIKAQAEYTLIERGFSQFRETFNLQKLLSDTTFQRQCQQYLRDSVNDQLQQIQLHAMSKFKVTFQRENGVLRQWRNFTQEEIYNLFNQSQTEVLNSLSNMICEHGLSKSAHDKISKQMITEFENEYEEALRKKVYDDSNQINFIYWGILLFFIYDDIYAWCKHPIFLFLLLCMGIMIGGLYYMGFGQVPRMLLFQVQNMVTYIVKLLINKIKYVIK